MNFVMSMNLMFRDVSNTPAHRLPNDGLQTLWELRAQNAPNLVSIPAAKYLSGVKRAELTYPYHCCALNDYGYGEIFYNKKDPNDDQVQVDCETGKILNYDSILEWGDGSKVTTLPPASTKIPEPINPDHVIDSTKSKNCAIIQLNSESVFLYTSSFPLICLVKVCFLAAIFLL